MTADEVQVIRSFIEQELSKEASSLSAQSVEALIEVVSNMMLSNIKCAEMQD